MNSNIRIPLAAAAVGALAAALPLVATDPVTAAANSSDAVDVIGGLGGDLHLVLARSQDDPNANLVFSPASLAIALTMTSAGASGDTQQEMYDVLRIDDASIHPSMGSLGDDLAAEDGFTLANALWLQDGFAVEQQFTSTLNEQYDSELQLADFVEDPAGAVDAVNGWVADATEQRITELLSVNDVTEWTRFILANAVHLDAEWDSPFSPDMTATDEFTRGDGSSVDTDFMEQTLDAAYAEGDGLQAIVLPYTNGYEMVIVLPENDGLAEFEEALAGADGDLDAVVGAFTTTEVALSLPTWDIDTHADLIPELEALGMTLPFDRDQADFSGVTVDDSERLVVTHVIHEANITVDEAGTEAAAATAVVGDLAMAAPGPTPPPPVPMDVDHPFFFAIRHSGTGAVVFQGHINDPS
ncbi:MAG: serpin family protein [Acidimicrobiales bacterium]